MVYVFIFGDSISYGLCDGENGGWAHRLFVNMELEEKTKPNPHLRFYNLSVPGDKTGDVLKRFQNETRARFDPHENERAIIIFAIGINDSQLVYNANVVAKEEFETNLARLANCAREFTDNIIFVGLTPVADDMTNPLPWRTGVAYKNINALEYDKSLKNVCERERVGYVNIMNLFGEHPKKMLEDGLRPNSLGHEIITKAVSLAIQ